MICSLFFQLALAALVILTAGCDTQNTGGGIQVSPPEQVNLTASNNGEKITLFAGQELVIQLDGNPTTGYTWEAKDLDATMFKQIGDATFSSSNPDLVGSGGTRDSVLQGAQNRHRKSNLGLSSPMGDERATAGHVLDYCDG